ncbi:MAG TPA: imidazole glycerol phosphate synthase subunit HisH [bacterium]|nr:imidazole glycerol phosphate synthase subunit HisH [bacterium]
MIAVIDYGMGNLRSVQKALERVGLDARVTRSARDIADADGVVLPGVGAFRDCMNNLTELELIAPSKNAIASGKPFLGICLGLQVLFTVSEEFGRCEGLNVFAGRVVRFADDMQDPAAKSDDDPLLKVPHMGWNQIVKQQDPAALRGIGDGTYYYFVHSYYVAPEDKSIAATATDYGIEFVSSIARDNVFACQFHPEKSQEAGLKLLRNFGAMVGR